MRTSRKALFFLIMGLLVSGIFLAAADFGESSANLGQFTDEFTSLDNVSVIVLIERNTTLNAMELNFSLECVTQNPENYSTFTKVGADSRLTVTDFNISTNPDFRRGTEEGYYVDLGAGNIGDFEFEFDLVVSDLEAGDPDSRDMAAVFMVTNWIGDFQDKPGGTYDYLGLNIRNEGAADNQYSLKLFAGQNGASVTNEVSGTFGVSTAVLYGRINRTAGDVYFWGFTDSIRTNLLVQLNDTDGGFSDSVQYLYGWFAIDANGDPDDWFVGSVANLVNGTKGAGYLPAGYFTTEDQLSAINGSVLVQLTNATIPAGTGITVEFSQDNATWGLPTTLTDGFQSIDLRDLNWSAAHYVRGNLSTTDPDETPRLYQLRVITTEGPPGATIPGAPGLNVSRETVTYNLTEIGVTVGTLDAGNLASTFDIDGDSYNVSELVGVPGMVISGNFTGVDPDAGCLWVVIYSLYDGNLNHDFDVELWNFTSSAWVEDSHIPDMTGFEWVNSTIYALRSPDDFLSGGEVRVRLDHEAAGNPNHDIYIEYFKLLAEIPAAPGVGAGAVTIIESDAPWIAIAIILMCVAYLLLRSR